MDKPKARKLTNKQEAYKNNRIAGMGVSESYRAAYDVKTMSDKALSVAANALEQDPRISIAIDKAKKSVTDAVLVSLEDVVRGLVEEAKDKGDGTTQSARVAAWKVLTDYTGGFDANRIKVDMNAEVTFNMDFGGDDE